MSQHASSTTADLPEFTQLLTPCERVCVGVAGLVVMAIWLVGLGTVAGYVWGRWLSGLFALAANWSLLP